MSTFLFLLSISQQSFLIQKKTISRSSTAQLTDRRGAKLNGATGGECSSKTQNTCLDFYNRFDSLWTFIYEEGVEPTNNEAERGLRPAVIWRKLSFGTQSEIGEKFVERIMSIAMTLKKRALNSFEYLTDCFKSFINGGQAPSVFVGLFYNAIAFWQLRCPVNGYVFSSSIFAGSIVV